MEALSTRLRLGVSRAATPGGVVGRHGDSWQAVTLVSGRRTGDKIVRPTGVRLPQIEQLLTAAAGKEHG